MSRGPLSELSNSHSEAVQLERALSRLQSGVAPEDSFRYIFERYHGRVLAFFVEKGLTREESDDAAMEVFLIVYRGISQLDKPANFEGWLFSLALDVFRNRLRPSGAEKPEGLEEALAAIAKEERAALLASVVQKLPPRLRKFLERFLSK